MVGRQIKKARIVAAIIIAVVVLIIAMVALLKIPHQASPSNMPDVSQQSAPTKSTTTETDATETAPTTKPTTPAVDPTTLKSIDIAPLSIAVFYTKGTPGFDFNVLKTADQTQYVQFSSPDLIGTKCTDDKGEFASIIKNPSSIELQTTSQTIKVGNDTYGLSLASAGCTGNTDLLTVYQNGFKNGFTSLAAL